MIKKPKSNRFRIGSNRHCYKTFICNFGLTRVKKTNFMLTQFFFVRGTFNISLEQFFSYLNRILMNSTYFIRYKLTSINIDFYACKFAREKKNLTKTRKKKHFFFGVHNNKGMIYPSRQLTLHILNSLSLSLILS